MVVGLMMNPMREDALAYVQQAADFLAENGVVVLAEDSCAPKLSGDITPFSQVDGGVDVIVCLGGDGTFLRGAQYAIKWKSALLGINLGRLGFLAEVEPREMEDTLRALISGSYKIKYRPLLKVEVVNSEGEPVLDENGQAAWYAMNDVVVSRGGFNRLIIIDALVNEETSGRYAADGIAVATPTGSTGYSLSAGGPVVAPNVDCMVITPICAHTLQHRPCVVDGGAEIRLKLTQNDKQTASLQVDGQHRIQMSEGMCARIRKSGRNLRLISIHEGRFFQLVRDKLTEWTR